MKEANRFLIGIAGGSGSGKTSFLRELMNHFTEEEVALVSQDNYYLPASKQMADERGVLNFDLPTSIDRHHFFDDMMVLCGGDSIEKQEYTFNNPQWKPATVVIHPAPVIIMEGLFVFYYEEIREKLDYKVYIDVHHEERLQRRIKRDATERGYPEKDVRYQWQYHVMPAEQRYLDPFIPSCDLIVDNNFHYREGLDSLVATIRSFLNKQKS